MITKAERHNTDRRKKMKNVKVNTRKNSEIPETKNKSRGKVTVKTHVKGWKILFYVS